MPCASHQSSECSDADASLREVAAAKGVETTLASRRIRWRIMQAVQQQAYDVGDAPPVHLRSSSRIQGHRVAVALIRCLDGAGNWRRCTAVQDVGVSRAPVAPRSKPIRCTTSRRLRRAGCRAVRWRRSARPPRARMSAHDGARLSRLHDGGVRWLVHRAALGRVIHADASGADVYGYALRAAGT